jgi:hypothetical protein
MIIDGEKCVEESASAFDRPCAQVVEFILGRLTCILPDCGARADGAWSDRRVIRSGAMKTPASIRWATRWSVFPAGYAGRLPGRLQSRCFRLIGHGAPESVCAR